MKHLLLAFLLTCALLCLSPPAHANEQALTLNDFVLDSTDDLLTLRYGVSVTDIEQLRIALQQGAKLALVCTTTLSERSSFWPDDELRTHVLRSEIYLDRLTREYMLTLSNAEAPFRQRALKKLLAETWGQLAQPLIPMTLLKRGTRYTVTLHTAIEDLEESSWLPHALFFWAGDSHPEMQYTMDFEF